MKINSLCLALAITANANTLRNVAVLDFSPQNITTSDAQLITDRIRGELAQQHGIRVMERSQMEQILKEQSFQKTGACDTTGCGVEIGKLLSVDAIIIGTTGKIGSVYVLSARLVDIQTAEILGVSSSTSDGGVEELYKKSVPQVANDITSHISSKSNVFNRSSTNSTRPRQYIGIYTGALNIDRASCGLEYDRHIYISDSAPASFAVGASIGYKRFYESYENNDYRDSYHGFGFAAKMLVKGIITKAPFMPFIELAFCMPYGENFLEQGIPGNYIQAAIGSHVTFADKYSISMKIFKSTETNMIDNSSSFFDGVGFPVHDDGIELSIGLFL